MHAISHGDRHVLSVDDAAKDGGDDVAPVDAAGSLQAAQVGKEAGAFCAIGPRGLFVVDEGDEVAARQYGFVAVGPVAPAIGRFDSGTKALSANLGPGLVQLLHVVQEFEEEYPGEHGQAVQVAVEPLILVHDVAHGFDDAAELLHGGEGVEQRALARFSSRYLLCGIQVDVSLLSLLRFVAIRWAFLR